MYTTLQKSILLPADHEFRTTCLWNIIQNHGKWTGVMISKIGYGVWDSTDRTRKEENCSLFLFKLQHLISRSFAFLVFCIIFRYNNSYNIKSIQRFDPY